MASSAMQSFSQGVRGMGTKVPDSPNMPSVEAAWEEGKDADSVSDLLDSPVFAGNMARHVLVFVLVAVLLGVAALVVGEFIGAMPTDGPFSAEMSAVEENIGTGLVVLAIGLIIIPVVAIVAYLWINLGGLAGLNGGGNGGMR